MPPRIARASVSVAAPKNGKNKSRKRNLDAYSIASHAIKPTRVAPHRLGESLDNNPPQKRRRTDSDDEDASEDDSAPRRKLPKSNGRGLREEDGDGVEEGEDSEGNEWTLGGLKEDDEDSDLDSEEAFGESSEERFEGFAFRGSSAGGKAVKRKQRVRESDDDQEDDGVDLDETERDEEKDEEEENDFGEEGVDLATMLDDEEGEMGGGEQQDDGEGIGSGVEDEEEASESESEDEDDDAGDKEKMARLRDQVEGMDAAYRQNSTSAAPDDSGIMLPDDIAAEILAELDPAQKKQHAVIFNTKRKSQAPKTLSAPLPKRQQDRLNREAATQKAKEQLDRWHDTVIHNRRAEFLTFPLVDPNRQDPIGKDKFVADGAPQGELEANIRHIMEESGLVAKPGEKPEDEEEQLIKAEELGTIHLPVEEVMRRRAELKRARELLFREETKAKRVAKIKSRSYRRVHRKERERQAEKTNALTDAEGLGVSMNEDERERTDRKRAEQRMSTKHKESKFGKTLKAANRTVWDEGARDGVQEQARRQEELRRRIAGQDVSDDEEGSDVPSVSDVDDDAAEDEGEDMRTLRQLNKLRDEGQGIGQRGLGRMKFMRAAEERQRTRTEEDIERLRKEMAIADGDEAEEGSEVDDEGLGRAIFGPKGKQGRNEAPKKAKRPELEQHDASDDGERGSSGAAAGKTVGSGLPGKQARRSILKKPDGTSTGSGPLAMGRNSWNRDAATPPGEPDEVSGSWLRKDEVKKWKRARESTRGIDGESEVSITPVAPSGAKNIDDRATRLRKPQPAADKPERLASSTAASNIDGWQTITHAASDDQYDSDADELERSQILSVQERKSAFNHRAFAGDDVQAAFEAEKATNAAEEDEQEVSTHLPGWGSWTGDGLSKSIRKANKRQQHNPLFKHKLPGGVQAGERKDAKLDRVIVSEKTDRKGKKYLAPILSHDFERKEQYERSLRVPVGPEWTTKEVFQRGTRPRVVVKQGVVAPMERPVV